MNIVYEEWKCDGIWIAYGKEQMLCIKNFNTGIIVAIENSDGTLEQSTSFASSEYMEAFSEFMNKIPN